jgi:hypothetical protein
MLLKSNIKKTVSFRRGQYFSYTPEYSSFFQQRERVFSLVPVHELHNNNYKMCMHQCGARACLEKVQIRLIRIHKLSSNKHDWEH